MKTDAEHFNGAMRTVVQAETGAMSAVFPVRNASRCH